MTDATQQLLPQATVHHVRDTCLCLHAQRAARVLARRFDEALRPFGLTNGQFSLMMALNRQEPAMISRLAPFLGMDRTTLTAALKPLVRQGFVAITQSEADRRSRLARITPRGVAVLRDAVPVWQATHAELDAAIGEGDAETLRRLLRNLG